MNERCDVGGDYYYSHISGQTVYWEPCPKPTYRWHQAGPDGEGWADGWTSGHWNYRCEQHVRWLSVPHLVVEPLAVAQ